MQVTVVGAGYVGTTTAAALAYLGHQVSLLDKNPEVITQLKTCGTIIHERGLQALIQQVRNNITFTSSFLGIEHSAIIFIAVGTPSKNDGASDLSLVESAVLEAAGQLRGAGYPLIVNKSTVPPGTAARVKTLVDNFLTRKGLPPGVNVVSNPEFLREGTALFDTLYPDRFVMGAGEQSALEPLKELYGPILEQNFISPKGLPRPTGYNGPALLQTDQVTAELIKYAANAFLAMKISFINEFAGLAELLGADIEDVARGIGLDSRIGDKFLRAGVGWGGSCFGKDARSIMYTAQKYGYSLPLVKAAVEVNRRQGKTVVAKLRQALKVIAGSTVGILGLAFKPGTDDTREAPATGVITELLQLGAFIKVYDPVAMQNYQKNYPNLQVVYAANLEELAAGCDAVVLLTEWEQFKKANWPLIRRRMRKNVFIDGRNYLDPRSMVDGGFIYLGIGRRLPGGLPGPQLPVV